MWYIYENIAMMFRVYTIDLHNMFYKSNWACDTFNQMIYSNCHPVYTKTLSSLITGLIILLLHAC